MKRCPQCRRDYYDETLIYCLDDGAHLVDGPASKEPATVIRTENPIEAPTRVFSRTDENVPASKSIGRNPWVARTVAGLLVMVMGVGGFLYFGGGDVRSIDSIAVMPFANESGNPELEYLSDGITDTLIGRLSQIPQLSVKSRSSVFRYKGKEINPKKVGEELGVQAVLKGRVDQRDGRMILNLELVDVRNENAIWSEQYARSPSDLVVLQGEIARDVSDKLRVKLSGADHQRLAKNYTENPEAYQLYLKARFHAGRLILPETQKAISHFERAIALDPNYALAYVGIARAYTGLALASEMPPSETFLKAKAAARRAVEIDPNLPDAIVAAGVTAFWFDWDWAEAERAYKRVLELGSNSPEALLPYSHLLSNLGRHDEALPLARRCVELDPLDLLCRSLEGQFLIHAGKPDEALARLQEVHDLDRDFWMAHLFAGSAYIEKGMYQEAAAAAERATELSPVQTASVWLKAYALAKSGRDGEARAELTKLLELSERRFVPPYHIALIYHGLGETDRTLEWLERGLQVRDPKMTFLRVEPKWNNIRDDPRFRLILKRVGFSV